MAQGTGVLTPLSGSPFDSGANLPLAYATDSAGRLFIAQAGAFSEARVFTTAAGVPTGVANNPFHSGLTEASTASSIRPAFTSSRTAEATGWACSESLAAARGRR